MIDNLYIQSIIQVRMFALFHDTKDREAAVMLTDAIRKCANLEVLYYRVANNYIETNQINDFLKKNVYIYNYLDDIKLETLIKSKPIIRLKNYVSLFQANPNVDEDLLTDPKIIKYTKSITSSKNLQEIVKLYGLPLPK